MEKIDLGLFCEVHLKNGKRVPIKKRHKKAFRYAIDRVDASKVDHYLLRVTYLPGVANEAECFTKTELLRMYTLFTNKEEVDFVREYWGDERPIALLQ